MISLFLSAYHNALLFLVAFALIVGMFLAALALIYFVMSLYD